MLPSPCSHPHAKIVHIATLLSPCLPQNDHSHQNAEKVEKNLIPIPTLIIEKNHAPIPHYHPHASSPMISRSSPHAKKVEKITFTSSC